MNYWFNRFSPIQVVVFGLALLLFVPGSRGNAQSVAPYFRHLSAEDGLSQGMVLSVLQDRQGYMWFGMTNGLRRYDGIQITTYQGHPSDSTSLPSNVIQSLYEGPRGTLWIGTNRGLARYDRAADVIIHVATDLQTDVSGFYEDATGQLWLTSFHNGIYRLDPTTGAYTQFIPEDRQVFGFWTVNAIQEDRSGTLWVASTSGLYQLDPVTGMLNRHLPVSPSEGFGGGPDHILNLLEDPEEAGTFWLFEAQGLARYSPVTGEYERLFTYPMDSFGIEGVWWSMPQAGVQDPVDPSLFWLVNPRTGLIQFDSATEEVQRYVTYPQTENSLAEEPHSLYLDPTGLLWVGAEGGVSWFDPAHPPFKHYDHASGHLRVQNSTVTGVTEDNTGTLWVTTGAGGLPTLTRIDRSTGQVRYWFDEFYTAIPDLLDQQNDHYFGGNIPVLYKDQSGMLWIGTDVNGLYQFDPLRETFHHYPYDPDNSGSLSNPYIHSVLKDQSGTLWVGTKGGLNRLDAGSDNFVHYHPGAEDDILRLPGSWVRALLEDRSGRIWVVTDNAISYKDVASDQFVHVMLGIDVPDKHIHILHEWAAASDVLWLGGDAGLFRFDVRTEVFTRIGETEGLSEHIITSILEDEAGRLWIGTSGYGLYRYDPFGRLRASTSASSGESPETGTIRHFGVEYHRQSYWLSPNAVFKSPKGEFFFGSSRGVVSFFPGHVQEQSTAPPVVLTDFKLFGRTVKAGPGSPLAESMEVTETIHLTYDQNSFGFEFVALHYANSAKNQYAYRLDGLQDEWVMNHTQRSATFTNLDPGGYVFRVKAASSEGVWNEEGASVRIVIAPPWWRTWWAYAVYILLFTGGVFAADRFQRRRLLEAERRRVSMREAELRAELAEEQTQYLEALDHTKNRFFANISHEFRTPLTLLLGPLEEALDKQDADRLLQQAPLMQRNTTRLLRLVNQLLDLAKLEAGSMHLYPRRIDLVDFIRVLVLSFTPQAERDGLTLLFDTREESLTGAVDADKLEKIVTNLLSNAFKFTMRGGKVRVGLSADDDGAGFTLTVSDTGVGISEEDLPHVFDRFYQVDGTTTHAHESTGIGLALVKELIELHQGTICVESRYEFGTTFTVHLPLLATAPESASGEDISEAYPALVALETAAHVADPQVSETQVEPILSGEAEGTVLIVDDNADIRVFVRSHLETHYHILEAPDGEAGLALIRKHQPDLIISDVMMPKLDGYGLCRAVKTDDQLRHTPVILLTARAEMSDKIYGLEKGADDYMTKPFSMRELEVRVANLLLSRKHLRNQYDGALLLQPTDVEVKSEEASFMQQVLAILNRHLGDSNFNTNMLADGMSLSRRQVERRVKAITNQTPPELMRGMRLARASQILEARPGSIAEVAYAVGFKSPAHFTVAFRKAYGHTPSEHIGNAT